MGNTAAAAKNRSVEIPPKEASIADASVLSRGAAVPMLMFGFHSGAFAALFPIVLWCSHGDVVVTVWRLSLLLCSYFYCAACALSAAAAATKASLFFHILCVALFAFIVDAELSEIAGMVIKHLASVVMAGVFGHALAKHHEIQGAEKGASAAATKTLALANGNVARVQTETSAGSVLLFVVALACVLGCVVFAPKWLGECRHRGGCTAAEFRPGLPLFMVISIPVLLGIAGVSHGAVLGAAESEGWIPVLLAMCLIPVLLLGEVGSTVTQWIFLLGMTAFFGYCFRVHDSYMKIMRLHR